MVFFGKPPNKFTFVLKYPRREVRSNPYIQSTVFMVGHNINIKLLFQSAFITSNLKCSVMPEISNQASKGILIIWIPDRNIQR